jgi:signal transduction histidine kinase
MHLTPGAYALLGLTALVAGLVAVVVFAVLRFGASARDSRSRLRETGEQTAMLAEALQDAIGKLRAQERATAARADASERLSAEILSSLTSGLLVVGQDGDVQVLNPAGRQILGLPDDASPETYRSASSALDLWPLVDECLASGVVIRRRTLERRGWDGTTKHFGVTLSPLADEHGERRGAICLFTDLTAVMELEQQLRLKESLAAVGEMTAGIAHEFRNGLATIHGYSRLIELERLPDAYRQYIQAIREETDSLGRIVTNFLNFARPPQLSLGLVDLGAVCERVVEEVRGEAKAPGAGVKTRGTFGAVEGDEVMLRQALSNLVRNAVEACGYAGVAPEIVVEGEVDARLGVSRITVNDNGPGIDPGAREQIFQPFVTTKRDGTGLGLALVQRIIVSHNGRITAGESPQGGASFLVTLPLAPAD